MNFHFFKKRNDCNKNNQPQLVIITGCAGSGKTTIGKEIARQLGYSYIDKDTVTRDFTDYMLEQRGSSKYERESELYCKDILPLEYRTCFKLCREILENGCSVVLTIPFISYIQDFSKWEEEKKHAKIKIDNIKFIWINHDINTEHKNLTRRNADRDRNKLEAWENYANTVKDLEPAIEYKAHIYNNDCNINLSVAVEKVVEWIKK